MKIRTKKYKVAHLGLGPRGHSHIQAFLDNSECFEIAALCDIDKVRLKEASEKYKIKSIYTDAKEMLRETKPDVFCFITPLSVRVEMIKLAVQAGIKAIAFEKPIALTINEAYEIKNLIDENNIKAVVSHQLKYLTSMQKLKEALDKGAIGKITHAHAATIPWFMQLGTHFMDYLMWANGCHGACWAVGHVHGRHHLSAQDGHYGTDFLFGEIMLANGVRGILESGYLSPSHRPHADYWLDDRLTFYGDEGFAWADNTNRWKIVSEKNFAGNRFGDGCESRAAQERVMQARYISEFYDWLEDGCALHPCRYEMAYQGYEALYAIQLSAMENRRVDLPIKPEEMYDIRARMLKELPDVPSCKEWEEHADANKFSK